jgi:hypothetical protein
MPPERHPITGRFLAHDCEIDCLEHCALLCGWRDAQQTEAGHVSLNLLRGKVQHTYEQGEQDGLVE